MSVEKITDIGGFARFKSDSKGFTVCANESLKLIDNLELRGLYISLLMLPDDWKIHKSQLRDQFGIGQNKIDKYFTELKKFGLLSIEKIRNEKGLFIDTDYRVHVIPSTPIESIPMVTMPLDTSNYKEKDNNKVKDNKNIADSANASPAANSQLESLGIYRWREWQKIYPDANVRQRCLPKLEKMGKAEFLRLIEGTKKYLKMIDWIRTEGNFPERSVKNATTFLNQKIYEQVDEIWQKEKEKFKNQLITKQNKSSNIFDL